MFYFGCGKARSELPSNMFPVVSLQVKRVSSENWIYLHVDETVIVDEMSKILDCDVFDEFWIADQECSLFPQKNPNKR